MIFNILEHLYSEVIQQTEVPSALDFKINTLFWYLRENIDTLSLELLQHNEQKVLYKQIEANPNLNKIKELLEEIQFGAFAFQSTEEVRQSGNPKALAYWINARQLSLVDADLTAQELKNVAPYLRFVDCTNLSLEETELQEFIASCSQATHLTIHSNNIKELIELPSTLKELTCFSSSLTWIDLSNTPDLRKLNCSCKSIDMLNLSNVPLLKELACSHCAIKRLDLSKIPFLTHLICFGCPIQSLDLLHSPYLASLICVDCPLATLDLSHTSYLTHLNCQGCPIEELDQQLKHVPFLNTLYCGSKKHLKKLNLAHTPELKTLYCHFASFETLDLSHTPLLTELYCFETSLKTLDLSPTPHLKFFWCHKNPLESFDLAHTPLLEELNCRDCPNLKSMGLKLSRPWDNQNLKFTFKYSDCPSIKQFPLLPFNTIIDD